ncbi:hypothetical protein ACA910_001680 [Epithemia clementina (nom. ined.)]
MSLSNYLSMLLIRARLRHYIVILVVAFAGYLAIATFQKAFLLSRQQQESKTIARRHEANYAGGRGAGLSMEEMSKEQRIEQQQFQVQLVCHPKDDLKHQHRHSSNPYTAPVDIPSIFNCQHRDVGGRCRYFFPSNFFDPLCGLGQEYAYMVTETEDRVRKRQLWKEGPRVGFNVYSSYFKMRGGRRILVQNQKRLMPQDEPLYFERLSFIHVHKAGGTSMKETQVGLARRGFGKVLRLPWFHPRSTLEIDQLIYEHAYGVLQRAVRYPKAFDEDKLPEEVKEDGDDDEDDGAEDSNGQDDDEEEEDQEKETIELPEQVMFFTLVRDPVARFISSIGQVMGSKGSKGPLARGFRETCLKSNGQETIACCLKYVKSNSLTGFELHFAPQALDIAFTTLWQDIPVAVFSMEQSLQAVLGAFSEREYILNQEDRVDHKENATEDGHSDNRDAVDVRLGQQRRLAATTVTRTEPLLNRRNGTMFGYRPDPVLTQMSVQDYNATLLQEVCDMYKVDVIMLHALGYPTRCDHIYGTRGS